jgi:hypothetical protein
VTGIFCPLESQIVDIPFLTPIVPLLTLNGDHTGFSAGGSVRIGSYAGPACFRGVAKRGSMTGARGVFAFLR